ncbi:MAG: GDSL-type esterase/lipase family protein, partial [Actinomycetota bacterium]
DYVFIQFGHNDQPVKGDRSTAADGDFRDYLRQYVDEARARKIRPVLVTSVARRVFADGQAVTSLTPYADAMKAVAKERGVPLVDLHATSFAFYNRLGDAASADFTASAADRTHFSRRGGRAMARLVADALPAAVPELRPFLRERPRLTLPPVLFATPGVETAVYFDNAVLSEKPGTYRFRVICPIGAADEARWAVTPAVMQTGDHPLRLEALDAGGTVLEEAVATVRVAAADAGAQRSVKLLIVGDSLTHGSVYANELARLLSLPGNPRWTMLGTHRPAGAATGVAHEGYGGWTWERFTRRYDPKAPATGSGRSSPFTFAGKDNGGPVLDVARYFDEQCGGQRPDVITVMLGINDCFALKPDDPAALEAGFDRVFGHAETLLAAFRNAAPNADIGVCLTTPPNSRQAAFEANYRDRYTRWGWKRIQHRLVQRELDQFGGRERERIFLVPTQLNLDPTGGYPDNNAVHPNAAGYRQIGASIYAWLKARHSATR